MARKKEKKREAAKSTNAAKNNKEKVPGKRFASICRALRAEHLVAVRIIVYHKPAKKRISDRRQGD